MTIPAQHNSLFISNSCIMCYIRALGERKYLAPKPRLKACLDRSLQFSLSRIACAFPCHPHSYTAAVCFSWDFTPWLLGMVGMQQTTAGIKADLDLKLKCTVFLGKPMPTKLL